MASLDRACVKTQTYFSTWECDSDIGAKQKWYPDCALSLGYCYKLGGEKIYHPSKFWSFHTASISTGHSGAYFKQIRMTGIGRLSSVTTPVAPIPEGQLIGESRHSSKEFICSVRPFLNDRFLLQAASHLIEC